MGAAPIILVPGFWLGAWAWDEVAEDLRNRGHDVRALTLPGLDSAGIDRSEISLQDQVDAIVEAVRAPESRVVLAVHSGASVPGYAATDRVPEEIAHMIYVDTAPGSGAIDAGFTEVERPLPPLAELREQENLTGISEARLEELYRRAVPEPGAAVREAPALSNDARLDVPTTVICTSYTADEYKAAAAKGYAWMDGLTVLRNVTYVDLPTSHWPMWSRPADLARIIGDIAQGAGSGSQSL